MRLRHEDDAQWSAESGPDGGAIQTLGEIDMCAIKHLVINTGFAELPGALRDRLGPKHRSRTLWVIHVVRFEHEALTGITDGLQQHRQGAFPAQDAGDETVRG